MANNVVSPTIRARNGKGGKKTDENLDIERFFLLEGSGIGGWGGGATFNRMT